MTVDGAIRLAGVVQHYAWGDTEILPRLLGHEPDGRPWAEWWLGTHPNGPATLDGGRPLVDVVGELPYLLKVLAAAEPLSMQTHPDAERARAGHALGRYPDDRPKPELLCALVPTRALCGFRPVDATLELLDEIGAVDLGAVVRTDDLDGALEGLLRRRIDSVAVIDTCRGSDRPEARVACELADRYPGDPAAAVSLLLHLVRLAPGEAIHLGAGNLHAYLHGAGVELMGASDNVVRCGLTSKPVDVDELLHVVDTTPLDHPVLPAASRHELPEVGVALVRIDEGETHESRGDELAIDLEGGAWYLPVGARLEATATTFVVTH